MKLETLSKVFERQPRVKIFVATDEFGLCGYAAEPHDSTKGLWVVFDAFVHVHLNSPPTVTESSKRDSLIITSTHRVTRRIQTHRRHLQDYDVPESYFEKAQSL